MKDKKFDRLMHDALSRMEGESAPEKEREGGCLSEETIADYLASRLTPSEREKAEDHFSRCPVCRRLLIITARVEQMENPETDSLSRVCDAVSTKVISGIGAVTDALKISLAWVHGNLVLQDTDGMTFPFKKAGEPVPVRSTLDTRETAPPPISKRIQGYTITIYLEKDGEGICVLSCEVAAPPDYPEAGPIKVDLVQKDRVLSSHPLVHDIVQFKGIAPGDYEVRIRSGGHLIALVLMDITEGMMK
ncbi:MAG: hypothetical protein ACMUIL_06120 [bacterium]